MIQNKEPGVIEKRKDKKEEEEDEEREESWTGVKVISLVGWR